jgi:dihydrofolate reductase
MDRLSSAIVHPHRFSVAAMRKLVYFVACTVDGFIARTDGSFDGFLSKGEHLADLFAAFPETVPGHLREALGVHGPNRHFDTVLMGRATFDVGVKLGVTNPYPHLQQFVFSRSLETSPDPAVELVSGEPASLVRKLRDRPGKDIWLRGGSDLASQLHDEIDELILKINPVAIGAGIPLFRQGFAPKTLDVVDRRDYSNGFTRVRYRVRR